MDLIKASTKISQNEIIFANLIRQPRIPVGEKGEQIQTQMLLAYHLLTM